MSCFLVPMLQAVATTTYIRKTRNTTDSVWRHELPTLEKMLWGATVVLIVDHIASGELSWAFPFFTALGKTGGWEQLLNELLTVGVPMSLTLTAVWACIVVTRTRFCKVRG